MDGREVDFDGHKLGPAEDHPTFASSATAAKLSLDESEKQLISLGVGVSIPDELKHKLKVFNEADNQLQVKDVERIPMQCFNCEGSGEYTFAITQVPHFGKAEIACFSCDDCGWSTKKVGASRSNEAERRKDRKATTGTRLTLTVKNERDLQRTVLKSESATLEIPEIEFEAGEGEGIYSTVEGLLYKYVSTFKFMYMADSGGGNGSKPNELLEKMFKQLLTDLQDGKSFQIILEDPYSECHFGTTDASSDDSQIVSESYEFKYQEDANSSEATYSAEKPEVGSKVQAKYGDEWFSPCVVLQKYNHDHYFVTQEGKESEGGWQVAIEDLKDISGALFCQTEVRTGNATSKELMDALNIMAEHVAIEEGHASGQMAKTKKEQSSKLETEVRNLNKVD